MSPISRIACIFLAFSFAAVAQAAESQPPRRLLTADPDSRLIGGNPAPSKSVGDTILLMGPWGSGAAHSGQFQDQGGDPAWNGWTSVDESVPGDIHWQVSEYFAENLGGHGEGNLAAYVGDPQMPACSQWDTIGGYGNGWSQHLRWTGQVDNLLEPCSVMLSAVLNIDTEPGYDYVYLRLIRPGVNDYVDLWAEDWQLYNYELDLSFTVQPEEYTGEYGDQVTLEFAFLSDGAFSDQDCMWPTHGAAQIDDIRVELLNGAVLTFDDFQDGTFGNWTPRPEQGVGDFAQVRAYLDDADPCSKNLSPQACFIDDGVVVPGTGGSNCVNWCYGPNGYIVNTTGGVAAPYKHLDNSIDSPVMAWPGADYYGLLVEADGYVHEDLTSDAPGIFYQYWVRSTASPDPADIESEAWQGMEWFYQGGPRYQRDREDFTSFLVADPQWVQVRVRVVEAGYLYGYTGNDGYPAPYIDNVRVAAYTTQGPALTANEWDLAGDAFPATGVLDLAQPGANSVRFDMVSNIEPSPWNNGSQYGDSIVCTARPVRSGAVLDGPPLLHYRLDPNPVFDAYRSSGMPNAGTVAAQPVVDGGIPVENGFCFDLPDTGFLFPGDVLHYAISATDLAGGEPLTSWLPADTTGLGDFSHLLSYDPRFTVRGLPTVFEGGEGLETPRALFWNDGGPAVDDEWISALTAVGWIAGEHYDFYRTLAPTQSVGNGLGGRASLALLETYSTLLYSSGDLNRNTFGSLSGYGTDPVEDLGLVQDWLELGGRNLLLSGNHLAADLAANQYQGPLFLANYAGVSHVGPNPQDLLGGQLTPLIVPDPAQSILVEATGWVPYFECGTPDAFDIVAPLAGAVRLAEFTDPAGQTGQYDYAAGVMNPLPEWSSNVAFLPYDLGSIWSEQVATKTAASPAQRTLVLKDILAGFGIPPSLIDPTPVPGVRTLVVDCYPNPFNPRTRIDFDLPDAGHVQIALYDVRGREVRRLLDEMRPAGLNSVRWDGNDGAGRAAASGVYFYEVKAGDEMRLGKMMLVR